jgi:hypothetical protein
MRTAFDHPETSAPWENPRVSAYPALAWRIERSKTADAQT